jgi:hypothetical protein
MWLDAIPDYARRDTYELLRFVYRRRVAAFIRHLRERMEGGFTSSDPASLPDRYRAIERAFIEGEYEKEPWAEGRSTPVEVARAILREHDWGGG